MDAQTVSSADRLLKLAQLHAHSMLRRRIRSEGDDDAGVSEGTMGACSGRNSEADSVLALCTSGELHLMGAFMKLNTSAPIATLIDRASSAIATVENLLIAEIVAGNTIAGTPMAACGRVAFGMACAVARSINTKLSSSAALAQFAQQ